MNDRAKLVTTVAVFFGLIVAALTIPNLVYPTSPEVIAIPLTDLEYETGEVQYVVLDQPLTEDDPGWDCRTMGNLTCGVEINGETYLVTFDDGLPVTITPAL